MAKRKGLFTKRKGSRRGGGGKMKIPLAVVMGMIPGMRTPAFQILRGNFDGAFTDFIIRYTGWDRNQNNWNTYYLKEGLYPAIAGWALHYAANILGINKRLSRFGLPVEI
jgi:hypothetical protein